MSTKLFVGGLPYSTTEGELETMFAAAGKIVSVKIITDRDTGRSKGFGFVEMETQEEAEEAIKQFNGSQMGNRTIVVNEARPQEPRQNRGFGGGGFQPAA